MALTALCTFTDYYTVYDPRLFVCCLRERNLKVFALKHIDYSADWNTSMKDICTSSQLFSYSICLLVLVLQGC